MNRARQIIQFRDGLFLTLRNTVEITAEEPVVAIFRINNIVIWSFSVFTSILHVITTTSLFLVWNMQHIICFNSFFYDSIAVRQYLPHVNFKLCLIFIFFVEYLCFCILVITYYKLMILTTATGIV